MQIAGQGLNGLGRLARKSLRHEDGNANSFGGDNATRRALLGEALDNLFDVIAQACSIVLTFTLLKAVHFVGFNQQEMVGLGQVVTEVASSAEHGLLLGMVAGEQVLGEVALQPVLHLEGGTFLQDFQCQHRGSVFRHGDFKLVQRALILQNGEVADHLFADHNGSDHSRVTHAKFRERGELGGVVFLYDAFDAISNSWVFENLGDGQFAGRFTRGR